MKKAIKIALIVAIGIHLSALGAFAEEKSAKKPKAEAQEEQKKEVKTIFNYKTELGLTDKQVEDMKVLVSKLQNTINEKGKMINDLRNDLGTMIRDKENLKTIKSQLEKISSLQVEVSYLDIETARKIEGILTPTQLKKWQNIQLSSLEKLKTEASKTTKK
jgi:Spy/CpxP family protein refolding chaperone